MNLIDMRKKTRHRDAALSESDFELFDALQENPRASWADLSRRLGVSAPTVRRRWDRLEKAGSAWISTYADMTSGIINASVRVKCQPGTTRSVAERLAAIPEVLSVSEMTGAYDLQLVVMVEEMFQFRKVVHEKIGSTSGVVEVHSALMTTVFHEGSRWKTGALATRNGDSEVQGDASRIDFFDFRVRAVLSVLERDGRAPAEKVAAAIGTSQAHARRVVSYLIRKGVLTQRVDLATEDSTWPHGLALWMISPAAELMANAAHVRRFQRTRLCSALGGGECNLFAIVWLHSLEEAAEVEHRVIKGLGIEVADRGILMHHYKRMGHVLDSKGRRAGHVPWISDAEGLA